MFFARSMAGVCPLGWIPRGRSNCSPQWQSFPPGTSLTTLQRCTLIKDSSASHPRRVSHFGNPGVFSLQHPTPAAWIEIIRRRLSLCSHCCRNIRTFSQRRERFLLIVCISLLKLMSSASFQRGLHGQSSRSISLFHFHRLVGLPEHFCIAMNVCQQLLTAPSFAHGRSVPPHFIFLVLLPQLQCSRGCAWHFVARGFYYYKICSTLQPVPSNLLRALIGEKKKNFFLFIWIKMGSSCTESSAASTWVGLRSGTFVWPTPLATRWSYPWVPRELEFEGWNRVFSLLMIEILVMMREEMARTKYSVSGELAKTILANSTPKSPLRRAQATSFKPSKMPKETSQR